MTDEQVVDEAVEAARVAECKRVTCHCSEPEWRGGQKTCPDRGLPPDDWCFPCLVRGIDAALKPSILQRERERVREELQEAMDYVVRVESKLPGLHDLFDRVFPGWETDAALNPNGTEEGQS